MNPKDKNDRFFYPPAATLCPCGKCKHGYPNVLKCDAYPDGVPFSIVEKITLDPEALKHPCNPEKNIFFEPIN